MEVGDRSPYGAGLAGAGISAIEPARLHPAGAVRAGFHAGADSAELSAASRAAAQAAQLPDVREARVQELQQRIASGSYSVDAHDVAIAVLRDPTAPIR